MTINGLRDKITVSGNDSVGVFQAGSGATLTLRNLTVVDGSTSGGAGLVNSGTVRVIKSTFSGNSAVCPTPCPGPFIASGGAIFNASGSTLTVTNSTFSENSAAAATAGGAISNSGTATLKNTIVANSPSGGTCSGTITDAGYNIDDGTTCGFDPSTSTSENNTNPLLDPGGLAENGGSTQTIALQAESPAIDAIPQAENGCGTEIMRDQRGLKRPQGEGCDIGAFEVRVRRR